MQADLDATAAREKHACPACGAQAEWNPAKQALVCAFCGTVVPTELDREKGEIREHDLAQTLRELPEEARGWLTERRSVRCRSCRAVTVFEPARVGQNCEFCGSPELVDYEEIRAPIRPESLLPFKIPESGVRESIRSWYASKWLAPGALKRKAQVDRVRGMYLPYWTFDARVHCPWTAEAGHYYYTTESFRDSQGRQQTRRVRHVRWVPASGTIDHFFDDQPISGSQGVDRALLREIEPFPTADLVPYSTTYLSGFVVEHYQVVLLEAARESRRVMDEQLEQMCAAQVPGDTHRNLRIAPEYGGQTFKHVLVPVWLMSYDYHGKLWPLVVNGYTGRMAGRYPKSPWKVALLVLLAALLAALAIVFLASDAVGSTPPPEFVETVLLDGTASGAQSPTAAAYEPGTGHLWVLEKGLNSQAQTTARVRRKDAVTGVVTTALTLPCVDARGERGLLGIAFSPGWFGPGGAGRHVYLYYTRRINPSCPVTGATDGSRNRVSRFTENGGTLSGEEVLLDGPNLTDATNHNGGTLRFAPDGTLFVSMGDNDTDSNSSPLSRNLADLRGKILRIAGDGSIPPDNPFVDQAGVRPEIWAWGLRNPFRFGIDSQTGAVLIGDVGENTWEEIDIGVPGADYGYPCVEGPDPFQSCAPPPGVVTPPAYYYGHGSQTAPVSGNSVTGGPVYRHDAFPEDYSGNYFFGDFVDGWIRRARVGPGNQLTDVQLFLPDSHSVVDIVVSPAGCLTWVAHLGQGVREVCFVGGAAVADADGSGRVDGLDLARLGRAFGAVCADGRYDAAVDFDRDCAIDGDDLTLLAEHFGAST